MELTKVLKTARTTALRQLSDKDKTDEVMIGYINLGLEDMYSRFSLKTDEIIISLQDGKTLYLLDGTDPDVTVRGDVIDPDDVLMLDEAFDERGQIGINDDLDEFSIYTSGYDEVQVPLTADQSYISIIYKKAPAEVEFVDSGDGTAESASIPLPAGLKDALIKYMKMIAFESHGDLQEMVKREADYETACNRALANGVVPQDTLSRNVSRKGFK